MMEERAPASTVASGAAGKTVIQDYAEVPDGFCSSAWADIRQDILMVATGANLPGIRQPGTVITGCRDWFRPVIFKVERMNRA
jgi:uncharacterized repeat protein (TIGR04076 family)